MNNAHKSCKAFFEEFLGDKKPIFKGTESEDFLIIDTPSVTLKHDMINADINGHVGKIMSNAQTMPSPRIKSLFAIVSGVGRGKTTTLVEILRTINRNHPETL